LLSPSAHEQATYYAGTWAPQDDTLVDMLVGIYRGSAGCGHGADAAGGVRVWRLKARTLLLIGESDTAAIGKQWSPPDVQQRLGHYDVLGKQAARGHSQLHACRVS
jgi:hypothetical protein